MSRLRNVGRQAAAPDDLISKKDLDAFAATLPSLYVQNTRINQANGVVGLDANTRMGNAYLPTDISRTNLTASAKVTTATLEATGNATVGGTLGVSGALSTASLNVTGAITAGTTITATGALFGSAVTVTGRVKAATGDIPEIISESFKAKVVTVDSLSTTGTITATDFHATNSVEVDGELEAGATTVATLESSGQIHAIGGIVTDSTLTGASATVSGATTSGTLVVSGISQFNGQMRPKAGIQLGALTNLSQINSGGTAVPVQIAGGITTDGSIVGQALTATTVTATGKGLFADLESQAGLKLAGSITGLTDLSLTGNLTLVTAGKKITTPDINTGTLLATGQTHVGSAMSATAVHLMINGQYLRQPGLGMQIYNGSRWIPNLSGATAAVTTSGTFSYSNNLVTLVTMNTAVDNIGNMFSTGTQGRLTCLIAGLYRFEARVTTTIYQNRRASITLRKNGASLPETTHENRVGFVDEDVAADGWGYLTMSTSWVGQMGGNDYIQVFVFVDNGGSFGSDIMNNATFKPILRATYLGVANSTAA